MKVLFVYKGSGPTQRNSIIDAQAASIDVPGVEIIKFPLSTSGFQSYYKEIKRLKKYVKHNHVDLIHAHYSYSGIIAALTGKKTVCSLMGSDVFDEFWFVKPITKFFYRFVWKKTIVKSERMQALFPNSMILPNGVDFDKFKIIPKEVAIEKTNLSPDYVNIIFIAEDIHRKVKNYELAEKSVQLLSNKYKLVPVSGVTHDELVYYYNAADALLLTSLSEGSPNVVKEAMACNCPVVATDVGDVRQVIGKTNSCYICAYNPEDVAEKLEKATHGRNRTQGRTDINELNTKAIADKLCLMYRQILESE